LRCIVGLFIQDLSDVFSVGILAINVPLRTAFSVAHRSRYVVFLFSSRNFLFPPYFFSDPLDYSKVYYSVPSCLYIFSVISSLFHCCGLIQYKKLFQSSCVC
jgi:hypothetical protein